MVTVFSSRSFRHAGSFDYVQDDSTLRMSGMRMAEAVIEIPGASSYATICSRQAT